MSFGARCAGQGPSAGWLRGDGTGSGRQSVRYGRDRSGGGGGAARKRSSRREFVYRSAECYFPDGLPEEFEAVMRIAAILRDL